MRGFAGKSAAARGWFLSLAAFALLLQLAVPAGFMPSASARIGGIDAPVLVICTGHGPLLGLDGHGKPGKAPPKSNSDAPCGFAGHGAAAAPPLSALLSMQAAPAMRTSRLATFDLTPGLGLAAPPPPAQGPPNVLI
ncbi:MAG: hypothetical protein JO303_18270 [Caulobacteraceae bacterium]|nr:hypothetical protein [Caulobacteraceae bacterium]